MNHLPSPYKLEIQCNKDLLFFCEEIKKSTILSWDTEFVRQNLYWPKICLIQMGNENLVATIDPFIKGLDLDLIWELIYDPAIQKIVHAGQQDIEALFFIKRAIPSNIFDTQLAASLCGFGRSISYSYLVMHFFNFEIKKEYQNSQWSQRPLLKEQIDYALNDVIFLPEIKKALEREIKQKKCEKELHTLLAKLESSDFYARPPCDAWKKIKMPFSMKEKEDLIKELCSWREQTAQRLNIRKKKIISDSALLTLANASSIPQLSLKETEGDSLSRKELKDILARHEEKNTTDTLCNSTSEKNVQ